MATDDAIRQAEIQARAQAATKGPWSIEHDSENGPEWPYAIVGPVNVTIRPDTAAHYAKRYGHQASEICELTEEDAQFIAHARQDIPWLLQRLAQVEQEQQALAAWACASCGARFAASVPAGSLDGVTRCSQCVYSEVTSSALVAARQEMAALEATWREVDALDARDRGYLESWNTYQVCANELSAALASSLGTVHDEKEDAVTRSTPSETGKADPSRIDASGLRASEDGTRTTDEGSQPKGSEQ